MEASTVRCARPTDDWVFVLWVRGETYGSTPVIVTRFIVQLLLRETIPLDAGNSVGSRVANKVAKAAHSKWRHDIAACETSVVIR